MMKLLAGIIITVGLVLGMLSAATAYNPRLAIIDATAEPLTLNAPAGATADNEPILDPASSDEPILLTAGDLTLLDEAGVQRVRVKEFGWSRWDGRWFFLLACAALLAGAIMLRIAAARDIAASRQGAEHSTESPDHALSSAIAELEALIGRPAAEGPHPRGQVIATALESIRRGQQVTIADARTELVARLGLTGYAQFMDRFAAAERQLHRGWSAAVDGAMEEAEDCLLAARQELTTTLQRLQRGA